MADVKTASAQLGELPAWATGTPAEAPPVLIEVDTGQLTPEQLAALESLGVTVDRATHGVAEQQKFRSLDELFEQEEAELLGREFEWDAVPGCFITIAHASAARQKMLKMEAAYREKRQVPLGQPLPTDALLSLIRDAYFGTVVKGWRGMKLKGAELAFTEAVHRRLWDGARRYREFVLAKASAEEEFRRQQNEAARGNS